MLILGVLTSIAVFFGVALPVYALFRNPAPPEPPIQRRVAAAVGLDNPNLFDQTALAPLLGPVDRLARRARVEPLRKKVRAGLNASGNPSGYSVDQYLALCLLSSLVGAVLLAVVGEALVGGVLSLSVPVGAVVGGYAPLWSLDSEAQGRLRRIAKQLPYTLDLISLVMQAGSSFTEAVETLVRDDPDDDLNQELKLMLSEIEFGSTRARAMEGLAERIPMEALRSVIGAVNQADLLGAPLSQTLKQQADMLRVQRGVHAEKVSASASLRILVPSMLILAAVVVLVFAPIAIGFIRGDGFFG
ncbi:MAG: type II secretion system F family protein [Planctomycetota bacterium]